MYTGLTETEPILVEAGPVSAGRVAISQLVLAGWKTPYMEKDYGNRMKYEGHDQPLFTKPLPLQRCKGRSGPRLAKGMDGSSNCKKRSVHRLLLQLGFGHTMLQLCLSDRQRQMSLTLTLRGPVLLCAQLISTYRKDPGRLREVK